MLNYIIRRLILLPITLFSIVLVNFVIINLAPGDPVTVTEISPEGGATRRDDRSMAFGSDQRYLQFRERYGLTLPILFNRWPWISFETVLNDLTRLTKKKEIMSVKDYDALRITFGDQSRFIMPSLLRIIEGTEFDPAVRRMASRFFARGGSRQPILGPGLSAQQNSFNQKVEKDNALLKSLIFQPTDSEEVLNQKIEKMKEWYAANNAIYDFSPSWKGKLSQFFFETRFARYLSRVLTLDFGTLRNDDNKTVFHEVVRRFKYSLTLAITPLVITFVICQIFGVLMAIRQSGWTDYTMNFIFLILYALPIFVVAPFLIEKVALNHTFPFTNIAIPISGFTSPDAIYNQLNSWQRLFDVIQHIFLPLVAILYGSLAAEARLSRTAVLEVMRQDYVRTARAKGVPLPTILIKHVGRNAAITIVTSLAGSLGVVLGGSLIVETLFDINGFGKFFYDAILNRDYNVIMFSALAGSFLSLLGYLTADIAYTILDPRVTLD